MSTISADVIEPRHMGSSEIDAWHSFMENDAHLQSAFFSPEFAIACGDVYREVRVAIFHQSGKISAFLPFQFDNRIAKSLRLATRVGEEMSDVCGLISDNEMHLNTTDVLQRSGISSFDVSHMLAKQAEYGLSLAEFEPSYVIELSEGFDGYVDELKKARKKFVADTMRKSRKLERESGPTCFRFDGSWTPSQFDTFLALKRDQYRRTGATDIFLRRERRALLERLADTNSPYCSSVLTSIEIDDQPIAFHYGLKSLRTLHYWIPAYDPSYESVSPGRLLIWRLIEQAAKVGIGRVDMGAGTSQSKRQFSNDTYAVGREFWSHGNVASMVARSYLAAIWRWESLSRTLFQPNAKASS